MGGIPKGCSRGTDGSHFPPQLATSGLGHSMFLPGQEMETFTRGANCSCQCTKDGNKSIRVTNAKISIFSEFFLGCDYTLAIHSAGFLWGWDLTLEEN
jgi:hypothetical protein